jgi:hypothetical protein
MSLGMRVISGIYSLYVTGIFIDAGDLKKDETTLVLKQ